MSNSEKPVVRDVHRSFDLSAARESADPGSRLGAITKRHRAKVFKSGNSLALRLPAALGLEAGMEMELTVEPGGGYALKLAEPPSQKLDISSFWGKAKGLLVPEHRELDERPSAIAAREAALKAAGRA